MVAHYSHNKNDMNSNLLILQQAISVTYNYNKLYYISYKLFLQAEVT